MSSLKHNLPSILLILGELIVGILLLIKPESFTRAAIILLGIVLLAVGVVYLIRWLKGRDRGEAGAGTLLFAIVALLVGLVCVFGVGWIMRLFGVLAVVFGVFLLISGVIKCKSYFDGRKAGLSVSPLALVSAVLSVIFGVLIIFHPAGMVNSIWVFAGIALIIEAAVDFIALVSGRKKA